MQSDCLPCSILEDEVSGATPSELAQLYMFFLVWAPIHDGADMDVPILYRLSFIKTDDDRPAASSN